MAVMFAGLILPVAYFVSPMPLYARYAEEGANHNVTRADWLFRLQAERRRGKEHHLCVEVKVRPSSAESGVVAKLPAHTLLLCVRGVLSIVCPVVQVITRVM